MRPRGAQSVPHANNVTNYNVYGREYYLTATYKMGADGPISGHTASGEGGRALAP